MSAQSLLNNVIMDSILAERYDVENTVRRRLKQRMELCPLVLFYIQEVSVCQNQCIHFKAQNVRTFAHSVLLVDFWKSSLLQRILGRLGGRIQQGFTRLSGGSTMVNAPPKFPPPLLLPAHAGLLMYLVFSLELKSMARNVVFDWHFFGRPCDKHS